MKRVVPVGQAVLDEDSPYVKLTLTQEALEMRTATSMGCTFDHDRHATDAASAGLTREQAKAVAFRCDYGVSMTRLTMRSEVYAIRHKPTGRYLPARAGKGYSNDEPTAVSRPRLFWSRQSAKLALTAWLKGRWVRCGGYRNGPDDEGCEEDVKVVPVATRKAEEMEIVAFLLQEVGVCG